MNAPATEITRVAAAIILRVGESGIEYLLAQRPPDKVYSGYWEFPGGKVEPGESYRDALSRELREELNISISCVWPWLTREFIYPHAHVRLKFFWVKAWRGHITPLEHTGVVWTRVDKTPAVSPVLPANGPILRALGLPQVYALTNAQEHGIDAELNRLDTALRNGLRLIQIRDKTLSPTSRRRFAEAVMQRAHIYPDAIILVNDDAALAHQIGAHGLHLSASHLMALDARPDFPWVAASCHADLELARAATLNLDFALFSPVLSTHSHPESEGMGWAQFADQIVHAPLPIFALGGMTPALLDTARTHGAHGIAMLRGW